MNMTIGEFSITTGLTAKALRLYDERGILVPAAIDPVTGYRWYSARQIRHGQILCALREAGVPMAELADAGNFDIQAYRQRLEYKRRYEDVGLRLAETIKGISLDEWPVSAVHAPEQPWVGTRVRYTVPENLDATVFIQGYGTIERHLAALGAVLKTYDNDGEKPSWTSPYETMVGTTEVDLLVCRPALRDQRQVDWEGFIARIRDRLDGEEVEAVAGVLPARLEVSCRAEIDGNEENPGMAAGFAPRLAVEEYIYAHGLQPLSRTARELMGLTDADGNDTGPTTVRDVKPEGTTN